MKTTSAGHAIQTPRPEGESAMSAIRGKSSSRLPEDIVRMAIRLFNRDGSAAVSTNNIAAALGISSGNLHYHFRTKNDLSLAAYNVMESDLRHVLRLTSDAATVAELVGRQFEVHNCLWKHRYFFAGFDTMVRKDPAMRARFAQLHDWAVDGIEQLLIHYTDVDVLYPIVSPNTPLLVARNIWMLWIGWVRWEAVTGDPAEDDKAAIARLVRHHFSFQAILMRPELVQEVARHLDDPLFTDI